MTDLQTVIKAAQTQFSGNKVGILSFSISTHLATLAYQKAPFDFLVGDGYVSDPGSIVAYWKREANREFILPSSAVAVRKVRCLMLLISGTKDEITSLSSSQQVITQGSHRNRSLLTYEGDHLQATQVWKEQVLSDGYVRRIRDFAERI